MQYMMLTSAALLLAMDFAMNKIYQKLRGTSLKASLLFNSVLGFATAIIFFAVNKFKLSFSPYSAIMAMLMTTLVMSYNVIGFRILKQGSMAIYSLFLMTGGMVLPYIWGLVFLNESFSVVRTIGLIVIIGGVYLSNFSGEKINLKQICMCISVFVLNGFVSIISKMHQIEINYQCVSTIDFIILGGIFKFFIAGLMFLILSRRADEVGEKNNFAKSLIIIIASAVIGGASYFLQLYGAKSMPATVLYPFITGGSIVFSTLVGAVTFKEKLSKKLIISVVLCFVGTIMFI